MPKKQIVGHSDQQELIKQAFGKKVSRDKVLSIINRDPVSKNTFESFSKADQEKILAYLSGEKTLQILYDKFFKKILDPHTHQNRVESLLSSIFGETVKIVRVLPKEGIAITGAEQLLCF